jgi:predicted Zn-dependent protease
MLKKRTHLNIVRIGSDITFSSLKVIGKRIVETFADLIGEFSLSHYNTPVVKSIDAHLLTMVLHDEYGGHILGITDADLKTGDWDEFYNSIVGGKNPKNDVAVVSTNKLKPPQIQSEKDCDLYLDRTLKVSLHELGHNFGLTDHASFRKTHDGALCPMSRGEFNKFGYRGYVRVVIDGRGLHFCEECTSFLNSIYGYKQKLVNFLKDGLVSQPSVFNAFS